MTGTGTWFSRCAECHKDTEATVESHCRLCHVTYQRGTEHRCATIDRVLEEARTITDRAVVSRAPRSPFGAQTYLPFEVPIGE